MVCLVLLLPNGFPLHYKPREARGTLEGAFKKGYRCIDILGAFALTAATVLLAAGLNEICLAICLYYYGAGSLGSAVDLFCRVGTPGNAKSYMDRARVSLAVLQELSMDGDATVSPPVLA